MVCDFLRLLKPFDPHNDSFGDIFTVGLNNLVPKFMCHHNSFPMNGYMLGFSPWDQKLENFVSPNISLCESKG